MPSELIVDVERRTITGYAPPYGRPALTGMRRWRFLPGSLTTLARPRVLRDHDRSQRLGFVAACTDSAFGLCLRLLIRRGPAGDRALAQAASGELGLSPGVDFFDIAPDPLWPASRLVLRGVLVEVSLTDNPAFD